MSQRDLTRRLEMSGLGVGIAAGRGAAIARENNYSLIDRFLVNCQRSLRHDDYSLEIQSLPKAPPEPPACALHADREEQTEDKPAKPRRKFGKGNPAQATLFDMGGDQ